jgi:hypothetical protein
MQKAQKVKPETGDQKSGGTVDINLQVYLS